MKYKIKNVKEINVLLLDDIKLNMSIVIGDCEGNLDNNDIELIEKNGEGIYKVEFMSRGEYEIEKVVDKKILNKRYNLIDIDSKEYYERCLGEVVFDYFYIKFNNEKLFNEKRFEKGLEDIMRLMR
jgi:hypothetical protein